MSYQNPQQKFPQYDNSNACQPPQVPLFQQMYYAQQQQVYGYEQQPFPQMMYNGYQYYGQVPIPQYNIPQQPTPVDSSNSISGQVKKKKKNKIKKDKKKKKKRVSSSSSSSSSDSSGSRRKKKSLAFLHNEDNWKCKFCNNINFPHRQECNRCRKTRDLATKDEKGRKGYIPNPDDWKCNICGNFNYARRDKCNRCKEDKPKAIQLQPNP